MAKKTKENAGVLGSEVAEAFPATSLRLRVPAFLGLLALMQMFADAQVNSIDK